MNKLQGLLSNRIKELRRYDSGNLIMKNENINLLYIDN